MQENDAMHVLEGAGWSRIEGAPNTFGLVAPWGRRWVARLRYVPTALGYPYAWGGESSVYRRSRRAAERWVEREARRGLHP